MKYLKALLTAAIVMIAVSGAVATNMATKCYDCSNATMYYFNGTTYIPAGEYGWDFYCNGTIGICTYYKPDPYFNPNYYEICRYGTFTRIP